MMLPRPAGGGKSPYTPAYLAEALSICETASAWVRADSMDESQALFWMAREVRGLNSTSAIAPAAVAQHLHAKCPELRLWIGPDDFAEQFLDKWEKVRILPNEDLLSNALRLAKEAPLGLLKQDEGYVTDGYKLFIAVCGWMCVSLGTDRIKIPCREFGELLGVRKDTVSSYRQRAERGGYLKIVKTHRFNPDGKGEATTFRFAVELWDILKAKMTR